MKLKIKKHIKQFIDYTLTDEFKSIVMISLVCFTVCGFLFGVISTALVNETLDVATDQKEKYDKLEAKYEELQSCGVKKSTSYLLLVKRLKVGTKSFITIM